MAKVRSREASIYLEETHGVRRSPATLNKYACVGGGPIFRKAGRDRIYDLADLDAYAAQIVSPPMRSTSEAGSASHLKPVSSKADCNSSQK